MSLAIIDLAYGNIGSIALAFERLGVKANVTADAREIARARRVVLPGVGAARHAMQRIDELQLRDCLLALSQPALGICLGMQLLFERSEEGAVECLGLIPGKVRELASKRGMPVPHMGWSRLEVRDCSTGLSDGDYVYFAHSYACDNGPETVASTYYGREIPAAVRFRNWLGVQFHPERSAQVGTQLLKAFLK